MKMREVAFSERPPIEGYGPGVFRLGGTLHHGGLMILPRRMDDWAPSRPFADADFAAAVEAAEDIDLLLVGMGGDVAAYDPAQKARIEAAGFGVEFMATPAACRTYNVLLAEERRVAAALIAV
jgi:uncharacterized protein